MWKLFASEGCDLRAVARTVEDEILLGKYLSLAEGHFESVEALTNRAPLVELYAGLGLQGVESTRLPPLYEVLILAYRWTQADFGEYRLLPHPPGRDLAGLAEELRQDEGLWRTLLPNGYVRFGMGPDADYDPVCFDFRHRQKNGDCLIVKIDHEEIFCKGRIRIVDELAPNFRSLVLHTIGSIRPPHPSPLE